MRYVLKLYVAGHTPNSVRAISNVKKLLERELSGSYSLEITDVLKNPRQALDYEILATPTLIRLLPPPPKRVIGDLSDPDKVLSGLDLATIYEDGAQPNLLSSAALGKRSGQLKVRLLLIDADQASIEAACTVLGGPGSPFAVDVALDGRIAVEKLGSKRYDCLLVDPDIFSRVGHSLAEAQTMAGPGAALVVLCRPHRYRSPPVVPDLTGVTFLNEQTLRGPGLAEKVSECLAVAHATRAGQVDALLAPTARATLPLLSPRADSIYRSLVDTLQDGILTVDPEGDILFTNQRTGKILDCDPDNLLGLNILALIQPEDRPWIRAMIDEALRGMTHRCQLRLACLGQCPVYVLVGLGPISDMDGGPNGVCLTLTDISEEKRIRDEFQRLATTDPLTGLYDRRYLAESLERECRRASRCGRPLSCLMIDIDGFKLCNDLYGHLTGDEALRQIAALIKDSVRDTDIVSRYGGEEFCVLLPETGYEGAMRLAERIRSAIGDQPLSVGKRPVSITVSIGVWATRDKEDLEPDAVLGYADAALMQAKAAGKNRVCGHSSRSVGDHLLRRQVISPPGSRRVVRQEPVAPP